ncbi:MAG: HAMP domain-containing sensor histidine kinase [Clostridia bacterium]|nr:HAMP domain-containing sensor histidine kinase [Clostridia bacterium]
MKRFVYSGYTKFVSVVLFVAFITTGVLGVVNGFLKYFDGEYHMYSFEDSFEKSHHMSAVLSEVESAICSTYYGFHLENGDNDRKRVLLDGRDFVNSIAHELDNLTSYYKIRYYVSINGKEFTNCNAQRAEEIKNGRFYRYYERNKDGSQMREETIPVPYYFNSMEQMTDVIKTDEIVICTSINEDYVAECEKLWLEQSTLVKGSVVRVFRYIIFALFLLVYLICTVGKNADGETTPVWVDYVWTEVHLAIIGFVGFFAVALCVILLDEYQSGYVPQYILKMCTGSIAAVGSSVILNSVLSVIRKIKCRMFLTTSIICIAVRWAWKVFIKITKWILSKLREFRHIMLSVWFRKTWMILIFMLFVYTVVIGICGLLLLESIGSFLFALVLFGFAAFVVAYRAKDIDEVKKGADEIRNGNLSYRIPELKSEDMKALAEDINEIGDGLNKSVAAKLKAERLKTDLITNVSHDLKTPLTSIISYTELLSGVDGLPKEAKDYVAIIAKKSERLKNLTQDLFDVSKVQSGTENFNFEKLDSALLISQAIGENDNEIQKSGLQFLVKTEKDLYISADGRKMSRVLGNLIDNVIKYAMKNTRVFLTAYEKNGEIYMEIKNISAYEMDFDVEEITGRFVRGDEARTDGGNGLGLAIAKGYVEALGGKFEIVIDGDLFKVVIKFDKV